MTILPVRRRWRSLRAWAALPLDDRSRLTQRERWGLLSVFALLVVLRLPRAWLQARFTGEEGAVFFAYAWHRPALDALFRSFAGYLNLGANGATLLAVQAVRAGWLPLERAPYLTMAIALVVQLVPALLLVTGRAAWLANRGIVAVALIILATSPMTEEVFVNVLHIQFHLALATALILALDVPRARVVRLAYYAPLLLAPLCGPSAVIVLPLFVLRAAVERDPARAAQAAALAAGTAIQLLLFFHPSPVRGEILSPPTIAAVLFVRLAALPLFTSFAANALGRGVYFSRLHGGIGWWWLTVAGAIGYFGGLVAIAWRDGRRGPLWLVLSALALGTIAFGGGMIVSDPREWFSVGAGERYTFLPIVLVGWSIIALAGGGHAPHRRWLLALAALTLLSGAITYALPLPELSRGPQWTREVAAWRRDHDHPLATWSGDWLVDLSDRDRPCPAPTLQAAGATGPAFCESAWLARVRAAVAKRNREKD